MPADDVPRNWRKRKIPFGIAQRPLGMAETMQLVFLFTIPPVVQKIVVQQCAADQAFHIYPHSQPLCHPYTHHRDRDGMVVTTAKAMLGKILFLLHSFGSEYITGMFLEKICQAAVGVFAIQVCHPSFSESEDDFLYMRKQVSTQPENLKD